MATFPFPRDMSFSVQDIRSEFERLLDRVWHGGINAAPLDGQDWAPAVDVVDEPLGYRIRVELPGMTSEQIEVSVQKNVVTIQGRKPPVYDPVQPPRRIRSECRFGAFSRRIELPCAIQDTEVKASCKNGVLTLELPKTPVAIGRTVPIEDQA